MAPAETSPAIIARLTEAVVKAVKTESTMAKFIQIGVDPIGNSSKEFSETLRSDIAIWSEAAKAANLKME
jgi:tripartite-type tricarboxylate transporter receptor subunit TctC